MEHQRPLPSPNAQATRPYPEQANPVNTLTPHSFTIHFNIILLSRDSVVGIATAYGLDDRGVGVRIPVGARIFSSSRRPDRLWSPPDLLPNGYPGLFPRGKAAGREADH
jgi:hypothetical protein